VTVPLEPRASTRPALPADNRGLVAIDLGCGFRKQAGAIGIDIARVRGVDILGDVTRTLPLRDSCADRVYASHIVEHLDDLPAFMAEIWRICKPGAIVYIRFPHPSSGYIAWTDPTHRRAVTLDTFEYFDPDVLHGVIFGYYNAARFKVVRRRITLSLNAEKPDSGDPWIPSHNRARRVAGRILDALANRSKKHQYVCERFWGPLVGMEEGHVWLRAIKDEPQTSSAGDA
jgi:SAM-dependent methyltransferase